MQTTDALLTLHAIFTLQKNDQPVSASRLARLLNISRANVIEALETLESSGLCEAEKVRLTMRGLVVAANYDAQVRRASRTSRAA